MTTFFEPINVSAAHIYHSALELSPEFSTVRRLYYDRRPTPFPRVAAGIADSWDTGIKLPIPNGISDHFSWSPCGGFVATGNKDAVQILDPLTAELVPILQPEFPFRLFGTPVYSPDGRSLACASDIGILIWDIQTGEVAKDIQSWATPSTLLVWSLDGRKICAVTWRKHADFTVARFDVVSGTEQSSIISHSEFRPCLWAHDKLFRVMTTRINIGGTDCTIDIFEVGPTLTKIESFDVRLGGTGIDYIRREIESFSPTTYRISVSDPLLVLDIRNSGRLLDETQRFYSDSFSPDGGFFAASQVSRSEERRVGKECVP